jgi:hypothetical protein
MFLVFGPIDAERFGQRPRSCRFQFAFGSALTKQREVHRSNMAGQRRGDGLGQIGCQG